MKIKTSINNKAPIYGALDDIFNNLKQAKTSLYVLHLLTHLFD